MVRTPGPGFAYYIALRRCGGILPGGCPFTAVEIGAARGGPIE
jgi:hypothetical protein